MKIAIIILSYNSSDDCRKCISSLRQQVAVTIEIVVVDNCSCPEDLTRLRALCAEEECVLIENRENRGYNAGNNIGLRYAAGKGYEHALIANPDMEFPQEDYLIRLAGKMEQDEQIAVIGSDIVTPEDRHQNPMRESTYYEELFWPVTFMRFHRKGKWYLGDYTRSGYCEKISGCCLLVRLSFIKRIGYFDETVFLYSEEAILARQVASSGYRMYYLAHAWALHRHLKSEKGDPRRRMRLLRDSRKYYVRHYSGYSSVKLRLLMLSLEIEYRFLRVFL